MNLWRRFFKAAPSAVSEDTSAFVLPNLRECLEALAAPGPAALALLPEGSVKADELALDFDNWGTTALGSTEIRLTELQRQRLRTIDGLLSGMSGEQQAHLWTDDAVCSHPKWREVREASALALDAFGWRNGNEPTNQWDDA